MQDLIPANVEHIVHNLLRQEFERQNCRILGINGTANHVHCLFIMDTTSQISVIIKNVKGSVSHTINKHDIIPGKFAWQSGFYAFSLGYKDIDTTLGYLQDQKVYHKRCSGMDEINTLLAMHGINPDPINGRLSLNHFRNRN